MFKKLLFSINAKYSIYGFCCRVAFQRFGNRNLAAISLNHIFFNYLAHFIVAGFYMDVWLYFFQPFSWVLLIKQENIVNAFNSRQNRQSRSEEHTSELQSQSNI